MDSINFEFVCVDYLYYFFYGNIINSINKYNNNIIGTKTMETIEIKDNLDLATRDQYLVKIQEQIVAKRQMLLNKQKSLKQTMKQNDFLRVVHEDYSKYDYIVKQKEAQIYSMDMIKQYLNDIIVSGNLTKEDIEKAKLDQKNILREINHVKSNLDEVMNETGTIRKKVHHHM